MKRKLSTLKTCDKLLKIRPEDSETVSRYRQAMKQGEEFPPIVITNDNIIVDGHQRYFAYLSLFELDHTIEVRVESLTNIVDIIEYAVRENVRNGKPLTGFHKRKAIFMLIELGRKPEQLVSLFGQGLSQIKTMIDQHVIVYGQRKPIKPRGIVHMKGKEVTPEQYKTHANQHKAMDIQAECKQLCEYLEWGWIDLENESNIQALQKLRQMIDEKIGVFV